MAGNGTVGFCGDGGPATNACLANPVGVGIDGVGNVLIPDLWNHRIRRVDGITGIITTVAGGGTPTPGFCGDGGPATNACLNQPWDVTVDQNGNMFIADVYNYRVRRVGE